MLPRPRAGDVEQSALGFVDVVQFRFVGCIGDPLVERQNAFVASHHDDGAEFQSLCEAHGRGRHLGRPRKVRDGGSGACDELRRPDEQANLARRDSVAKPRLDGVTHSGCFRGHRLEGLHLGRRTFENRDDPAPLGLKPVACESAGGYIFVCVAANPPDFEGFRRAMTPYFERHGLAQAKLAHETTTIENGNWKLVWENNRECYHCSPNHPELCRTFPESPTVAGVAGALADPEIAAHFERMEKLGLPSRFQLSALGDYRLARMPLIPGVVSYTLSGQAAVKRPLSDDIAEPSLGTLMLFNYPSTWNHVLADHAVTFRVTPLGPTQTAVTTKWLVHKDAVEGVDYTIDELTHVWNSTNDQDRRIVE